MVQSEFKVRNLKISNREATTIRQRDTSLLVTLCHGCHGLTQTLIAEPLNTVTSTCHGAVTVSRPVTGVTRA
jgi:hypothetical protein